MPSIWDTESINLSCAVTRSLDAIDASAAVAEN